MAQQQKHQMILALLVKTAVLFHDVDRNAKAILCLPENETVALNHLRVHVSMHEAVWPSHKG